MFLMNINNINMYEFFDEIIEKSELPIDLLNGGFRIVNFSNKCVYVENYVNIVDFCREQITVKLKKGIIKFIGKNLMIKNLNLECLMITGQIDNLEIC